MNSINYDYFITIAETGSLTKAAERLYVSQPSLSQYLKRLEKSLDVELFDHRSSPLRLTYAGERYYEYAMSLRRMNRAMEQELQDLKNELRGRIRLGIALWRGACFLPDIYPMFHKAYPDIRIELFEGRSDQLERALINDNLDLAVMSLPHNLDYNKLTSEIIFEEPILLAVPTQHPEVQKVLQNCSTANGYPIAPVELIMKMPVILTQPGQNLTHEIRHFLGKHHMEPDVLLETGNLTTAINLAAEGIACTFVPEEGAKVCSRPGKVTYFLLDDVTAKWPLAIVYNKGAYLPKHCRAFITAIMDTLGRRSF